MASEENSQMGQMKISREVEKLLPSKQDYTQPQNSKNLFWKLCFQNTQMGQGLSTLRDKMVWLNEIPMKNHGM